MSKKVPGCHTFDRYSPAVLYDSDQLIAWCVTMNLHTYIYIYYCPALSRSSGPHDCHDAGSEPGRTTNIWSGGTGSPGTALWYTASVWSDTNLHRPTVSHAPLLQIEATPPSFPGVCQGGVASVTVWCTFFSYTWCLFISTVKPVLSDHHIRELW